MEKLFGSDYMSRPFLELVGHPDFSQRAMNAMAKISKMSTEQIEAVDDLLKGSC